MPIRTAFVMLAALAAAAGCGSSGSGDGATGTARASLHRAKGCGDLLDDLKADVIYKLNRGIDRQIEAMRECIDAYSDEQCGGGYGGSFSEGGERTATPDAPNAATGAAPPRESSDDSASDLGGAQSYSETNTQVKGVDEADIVKNDGQYLYVLHGRAFKVLKAWPADALEELSSTDVEGRPTEMFVADGKVVIYSQVNGASIFAAAGVAPKTPWHAYGYSSGGGAMVDRAEPMPMPMDASGASEPYVPLTKITVMTLDGATPTVTREAYFEGGYLSSRRVGSHVRTVLQSVQYGPKLKYGIYELYADSPETASSAYPKTGNETIAALEQLRSENLSAITSSQLSDWLPYTFVKESDGVHASTVACEDFYVPTIGSTESGLTEVASLDLANPAATPRQTAILGRADTVYGNTDTLYLAAHAWVEPPFMRYGRSVGGSTSVGSGSGGVASPPPDAVDPMPSDAGAPSSPPEPMPNEPSPSPTPDGARPASLRPLDGTQPTAPVVAWSAARTHVHKFEFKSDPGFPNYVASGTVVGSVNNQFSLDEKDDRLRIATTEDRMYVTSQGDYVSPDFSAPAPGAAPPVRPSSVNHVFVLEQKGPWLDLVGDVGALAPNERIYSVRFVGDRGYVVTFRRVDPLFVLDLSAPSTPRVLGELEIPGFSEYMHPLDANHLLTIGRAASETGMTRGLQLQIFDVTDGAHPVQKHVFEYTGSEYGSSQAEYDHKAFTYFGDRGLLAFPYYGYDGTDGSMRSSLELFKVDVGAGFSKLGSIDHTALFADHTRGYCGGYYGPYVRRGVFLENFVYSISYAGVVVRNANDLLAPGSELALSSPQVNDGYGPVCAAYE